MLNLTRRFSFGIDLDDYWTYSGQNPPKSIIIPQLLSVNLPEKRASEIRYKHQDLPEGRLRASLTLADNLTWAKIDFARCWFPWNAFEPSVSPQGSLDDLLETSYSEWPMEHLVRSLADRGISLIPVIACGYQRMLPRQLSPDLNPGLYIKRASTHARLLVRKYRKLVNCWQIENEPNWWLRHLLAGWRSGFSWAHPRGFKERLLQALNDAVHAEDPNGTTIINLEADSENLSAEEYSRYCDVIGLDFFPNYRASSPVNTSIFGLADKVARQTGKPVVILETGYPSRPALLGYSEAKQAQYVERACRHAFHMGRVNGVGIWRYADTSWKSFPPHENSFGLIDWREGPKPGWTAYAQTIRSLK